MLGIELSNVHWFLYVKCPASNPLTLGSILSFLKAASMLMTHYHSSRLFVRLKVRNCALHEKMLLFKDFFVFSNINDLVLYANKSIFTERFVIFFPKLENIFWVTMLFLPEWLTAMGNKTRRGYQDVYFWRLLPPGPILTLWPPMRILEVMQTLFHCQPPKRTPLNHLQDRKISWQES